MLTKFQKLIAMPALLAAAILTSQFPAAQAQGTAFTYQGLLQNGSSPANGLYDFQIKLFLDDTGSSQAGPTLATNAVGVTNGSFVLLLNFGSGIFNGSNYWLQLGVRSNNVGSFADLAPLQAITPTPYAIYAESGGAAQSLASGAAVGGGSGDTVASGDVDSFIGGGYNNTIVVSNNYSTISGGDNNSISTNSYQAFIGGGTGNAILAISPDATITGGFGNTIQAEAGSSSIGGGEDNQIFSPWSTVAGGDANIVGFGSLGSAIGGGFNNTGDGVCSTVAGGYLNLASGNYSFAAGQQAQATNIGAFVWADSQTTAFGSTASNQFSARAAGGVRFVTTSAGMSLDGPLDFSGPYVGRTLISLSGVPMLFSDGFANLYCGPNAGIATIQTSGGGFDNAAFGHQSLSSNISGYNMTAFGRGTLTFNTNGYDDTAVGENALFYNASGYMNTAFGGSALVNNLIGFNDIAVGYEAGYNISGNNDIDIGNGGVAGESGIIRIGTNGVQTACYLAGTVYANGTFVSSSDRNAKENFKAVNTREVLDKVMAMPVSRWNYKGDARSEHIGPMAQDFYSAFKVGPDDTHITTIDEGGIALAAIQGLNEKLEEKDAEIERLKAQASEVTELKKRLDRLENLLARKNEVK